jgi:hypothetical protein
MEQFRSRRLAEIGKSMDPWRPLAQKFTHNRRQQMAQAQISGADVRDALAAEQAASFGETIDRQLLARLVSTYGIHEVIWLANRYAATLNQLPPSPGTITDVRR